MKKIVKIVTFYDDGTFTESTPSPYMPTQPAPNSPYPWPNPIAPVSPYPNPWPSYPPYTITCKMEDGTIKEIPTGPIMAQGSTSES